MRSVLVLAVISAATAVVLLFTVVGPGGRANRDGQGVDTRQTARAARSDRGTEPADAAVAGNELQTSGERADKRRAKTLQRLRLLYDDGEPACGVTVRCGSGRKLVTRMFRNGDYPEKTIWMVTSVAGTVTDEEGRFTVCPAPGGPDAVLYTDADSTAVLLAAWEPGCVEYRAARRVTVTGTLRGADGKARKYEWLSAHLGSPEDYDTRNRRENDSFVSARGGLDIDPLFRFGAETDERGRFTLLLAPGTNTLLVGESGKAGRMPIEVPTTGSLDLGDISPPAIPTERRSAMARELHGTVRSLSGAPLPGALVRLWDGNVGEASHEIHADDKGAWRATGLHAHRVIAWALSSHRHHMVLPQQSSGTIHMPCNTSISLVAPNENEYAWARIPDINGFFLFVRDDVFLGAELLAKGDTIGLPQGRYRIYAVTNQGIRELSTALRASKSLTLGEFR